HDDGREGDGQSQHRSVFADGGGHMLRADFHESGGIRPAMHPAWRRCSSVKYSRYSSSSRLARRAPRRPRCVTVFMKGSTLRPAAGDLRVVLTEAAGLTAHTSCPRRRGLGGDNSLTLVILRHTPLRPTFAIRESLIGDYDPGSPENHCTGFRTGDSGMGTPAGIACHSAILQNLF